MMKWRNRLGCLDSCDQLLFRNSVVKTLGWVMVDCGVDVVICMAAAHGFKVVRG